MANYTGAECELCHKKFNADDDVVVCPECGTPYHRECYLEAGECINTELHEKGGDWQQFHGSENVSGSQDDNEAEKRCPRCGQPNPSTGLFCIKCGMPLNSNQAERPFNNVNPNREGYYGQNQNGGFNGQDPFFGQQPFIHQQTINLNEQEIDGHKSAKYAKFVKKNPLYYLANFFNFSKGGSKASFNISAIFVPELYFLYRKMYFVGIIMVVLSTVLALPELMLYLVEGLFPVIPVPEILANHRDLLINMSNAFAFIGFGVKLFVGIFANYWYFRKAKKTIDKVEAMDLSDQEKDELLSRKGGTSGAALVMGITALFALLMIALLAVNYIF